MSIDLNPVIDQEWVSATYTRNYILKDPILDWLNLYGHQRGYKKDSEQQSVKKNKLNFTTFIMNRGQEFERYIRAILKDKCGENFVEVNNNKVFPIQKRYKMNIQSTYSLMERGVKVIYQGMVFNPYDKTFGFPDLIVRSDYLNELFETPVISPKKSTKGCRFSENWHYRIIDIKYFSLKLNIDKTISSSSSSSVGCYKVQNYIYNNALGYMQHFIPSKAYILGRGYYENDVKIMKPFAKAGKFNFIKDKDIKTDCEQAVQWIRRCRTQGSEWKIKDTEDKPSVVELYPNMNNTMDYDWHNTKSIIASQLNELTCLWQCGVKNREFAFKQGVYRWNDEKCFAYNLDITGKNCHNLDCIISINRHTNNSIYHIDRLKLIDYIVSGKSFFVDFENVYNLNDISGGGDNVLFLIGCGHSTETESWKFANFCTDKLTKEEEKHILQLFVDYLHKESGDEKKVYLFHYNITEPTMFSKLIKLHNIKVDVDIVWVDILTILKECHFAIKDCLDYSLKNIIKSLVKYNFSDVSYNDSEVYGGLEAMVGAFIANEEGSMNSHSIVDEIKNYNELDCKSLKTLWGFLRKMVV